LISTLGCCIRLLLMKSAVALWVIAFAAGLAWRAGGQDHALNLPQPGDYATATTGVGSTSKNSSGAAATAAPNEESNTAEHDDSLYRGKTSDMETTLLRDEGALHFKTHPKEKIQNVDSLKSLQSSGTDPKFQGSLLNSDINAIEKISEKANETRDAADEGDPRFKTKRLTFTPDKNNESKKAQSDSSPSPTPSPTTSPAAKNSGETKQ
jgi:hypothetical protein